MTIVDHHAVDDLPWRPNYSVAHIAGSEQGVTSSLVYSEIGAGAGAPLHTHEDDELIVVLDGIGRSARISGGWLEHSETTRVFPSLGCVRAYGISRRRATRR